MTYQSLAVEVFLLSKKSFVKGAAVLAVAGIIAKLFGALFRIPLINIIGTEGIGLYQLAYPIYSFLLIVSTAGIPTAISKLVAEKIALKNHREAHRVFVISVKLMLAIGITIFIIFSVGSRMVARILGSERAFYSILAISPCLVFVSLLSAFRGYFQGMQNMVPTALTQILEQVGKLALGLFFASLFISKGPEYGAAAAVAGVTLSEAGALVTIILIYRKKRRQIMAQIKSSPRASYRESDRSILERLLKIAFPVTIGSAIMPLVGVADAVIVVNRLKQIGIEQAKAESLYGILTGNANPLINFPAVLTIALAMSLVPAITESFSARDLGGMRKKTSTGIRLTLLIGIPAAAGMAVLAEPICALLYKRISAADIKTAAELLTILSIGVVFLSLVQTLTAILQGLNKITVPVKNLAIGAMTKIILTYALVGNSSLNVKGAAIATVVCYGIAASLDFIAVIRYSGISIPLMDFFIKPLIGAGLMSLTVYLGYHYLLPILGTSISTLLSVLVGIVVYSLLLLLTGAVKKGDFELLPAGKRISSLLVKLKLLKD